VEGGLKQVVVIGGGHAGIVPTPRLREAERGSGRLDVARDRREASIPLVEGWAEVLR
jgi:NADH dehydrogenase FAD-containing subunit